MRIKDVKNHIVTEIAALYEHDECLHIAEWLLEDYLNYSKLQLNIRNEEMISEANLLRINQAIIELKNAKPIQQILGYSIFYGLKIGVNDSTLIPRPETEELVSIILENINKKDKIKILDIGTGSGCIALALKSKLPLASINAMDISKAALKKTAENTKELNLEINLAKADILTLNVPDSFLQNEIIISNPPYIHVNEKAQMHANVLLHEPHTALFVYDDDVLLFYKKIIQFAKEKNGKSSLLFFEINEAYGEQLITYLLQHNITEAILIKDMQGKNRFIKAHILVD